MGQALCCIRVDQSAVALVEHFGAFEKVLEPGCHCLPWCLGEQLAGVLSLHERQIEIRCETKTKDDFFVTVVASVEYRVVPENSHDAFYNLSNTTSQIQSHVLEVIRASVSRLELDSVFLHKIEIAKAVKDGLQEAMYAYGIEIVHTLVVDEKTSRWRQNHLPYSSCVVPGL